MRRCRLRSDSASPQANASLSTGPSARWRSGQTYSGPGTTTGASRQSSFSRWLMTMGRHFGRLSADAERLTGADEEKGRALQLVHPVGVVFQRCIGRRRFDHALDREASVEERGQQRRHGPMELHHAGTKPMLLASSLDGIAVDRPRLWIAIRIAHPAVI